MIRCQVNCHFNRLGKYNINNDNFVHKYSLVARSALFAIFLQKPACSNEIGV